MRVFTPIHLRAVGVAIIMHAGCSGGDGGPGTGQDAQFVELDLEKRATDELVGYYMGAFLSPEAEDAFEARLVVKDDGRYFVDLDRFGEYDSLSAAALGRIAGEDRRVEWEAFSGFVSRVYFGARDVPETRSALDTSIGFDRDTSSWMNLDVLGVMSTQRRRVFVRREHVLGALQSYRENEDRIIYPPGTVFVGEHQGKEGVSETTVMRKSAGGYWDFFVYDREGRLADSTLAMPRSRHVPTQCVGCHFGDKLYEPERSFPAAAEDGPHGPRRVFVDEQLRDPEVVRYFEEHRHRSDRVLGLYATVLVSQLRADREEGDLDEPSASLLESLGL